LIDEYGNEIGGDGEGIQEEHKQKKKKETSLTDILKQESDVQEIESYKKRC